MVLDRATLEGKIFRADELAQALGMHPDSIRRAIRNGSLRATRPPGGRVYFITGEDALAYLTGGHLAGPRATGGSGDDRAKE